MKLSIITINYNNAQGLEKTIKSIVNQNYRDFEYIVIDGNSSDNSRTVIERYANKIDYWVSEPDSGIYNAMNKGIRRANGEYLLFINSGDCLKDNASMQEIMNQLTGEDIIYFDLDVYYSAGSIVNKSYPDNLTFEYFLTKTLPHPASFIKKRLFEKYGLYDENFKICSDWAFFIDVIGDKKSSYKHVKNSFSVFFFDGISSAPQSVELMRKEKVEFLIRKYRLFRGLYRKRELQKIQNTKNYFWLKGKIDRLLRLFK